MTYPSLSPLVSCAPLSLTTKSRLDPCRQVLTHGNTLLKDDEIEKLTLLRMNKEFMKFMRKNYSHLTKQQFNIFGYSSVNFSVNRSSVRVQ